MSGASPVRVKVVSGGEEKVGGGGFGVGVQERLYPMTGAGEAGGDHWTLTSL